VQQQRSRVMEMIHGSTLDSNAREAKERLDQKLRSKREVVIKRYTMRFRVSIWCTARTGTGYSGKEDLISCCRHHSTGSIRSRGSGGEGSSSTSSSAAVQREVYSKKGVMRRLIRWDAAEQAECAVCLDEFRAGDVLAHLPCGHRFHWACALPWLEGTSRCPFCRSAVDAGGNTNPHGHAAAA
jgi:hypothetical protein